jgi:DNA-binding helix-hairpin-helix protein with protein kinase domain
LDRIDEDLRVTVVRMHSELNTLDRDENEKIARLREEGKRKITAIIQSLDALRLAEQKETSSIVLARQSRHREEFLRRHSLYDHAIPGVSAYFQAKLWDAGYRSAYDLTRYRSGAVHGIGPVRAAAISAWIRDLNRIAQSMQPQSLSVEEKATLQRNYGVRRTSLERDLAQERGRLRELENPKNSLRLSYQNLRETKERESSAAKDRAKKEKEIVLARLNAQRRRLSEALSTLAEVTESQERVLEGRTQTIRSKLFGAAWQEEKARREARAWDNTRFQFYVRRIFLDR